jgi:hypothetical protein
MVCDCSIIMSECLNKLLLTLPYSVYSLPRITEIFSAADGSHALSS